MRRGNTPRQIFIEKSSYLWVIRRLDSHFVTLRVWAKGRSRRDFPLEILLPCSDPWLTFDELITIPLEQQKVILERMNITPQTVRTLIEAAILLGWGPHHPVDCRSFKQDATGTLVQNMNSEIRIS